MKKILACVWCWGLACAVFAQDSLQRLPVYQNALIAYQKAEYAQAETLFRQAGKAFQARSRYQETCLLQAIQCLLKQGRLAEAGEQIEALPESSLLAPMRANTAGELYLHLGRNDLALKAFERAVQLADREPLENPPYKLLFITALKM